MNKLKWVPSLGPNLVIRLYEMKEVFPHEFKMVINREHIDNP